MSETVLQQQVPLQVFIQSEGLDLIHQTVLKAHLWEEGREGLTHASHAEWKAIYHEALHKRTA